MSELARSRTRFTDADVMRMLDAGVLDDRRVELIDGDLIEMNPQGPVHANLTTWIRELLLETYGRDGFHVRDHSPVDISPFDQPEPDLALVRGRHRKGSAHPNGADLVLVFELAQSSVSRDRAKAAVYAKGGVPEYWIVDCERARLEVRRAPSGGDYGVVETLGPPDRIAWPERGDDVAVAELLP
jgi:Uma2 family endonuclease